jgi:SAM-dependent methyltransferase
MLAPFSEALLGACPASFASALDIGCGAGSLTLELAERAGTVRGVDVSSPLLALARKRAEDASSLARFVLADAASYRAEEPFDLLVSRFGVMFFTEPAAAFENLRRSAGEGAPLRFVCWQEPKENPWAFLPAKIAREELGLDLPRPDPEAPGPFAFASKERLERLLTLSGWRSAAVEPVARTIAVPGNNRAEAASFLVELGPLSRHLEEAGLDRELLASKLAPHLPEEPDGEVRLPARAWLISAEA